jgi:hypothetical protein
MGVPISVRAQRAARASLGATFAVAVVATIVLVGWIFDIDELKGAYGRITMKTNAAIGLLLCAVALWSRARN